MNALIKFFRQGFKRHQYKFIPHWPHEPSESTKYSFVCTHCKKTINIDESDINRFPGKFSLFGCPGILPNGISYDDVESYSDLHNCTFSTARRQLIKKKIVMIIGKLEKLDSDVYDIVDYFRKTF